MSPLDLLRAVCEALVARGEPAALDGEWLYIGEQPVAYVADRGLVVPRALCYDGFQHVEAVPTAVRQRATVAEIVRLVDERQAARAKSLPEPEAGPSREPGEVSCAA